MEAGKVTWEGESLSLDMVDAMVVAADESVSDEKLETIERSACPTCGSCSGMFTANSMNCLTESIGLALPGNGSLLATYAKREELFRRAGKQKVDNTKQWYENEDRSVLPRTIASFEGFENAITLDIAMGGSTNTILHLLATVYEADVPFSMDDNERLSRLVPCICKVAPAVPNVHMEDVHRAGGVMALLSELRRAGLLHTDQPTVHSKPLSQALDKWDISNKPVQEVEEFYRPEPGGVPTQTALSQNRLYPSTAEDRKRDCIRCIENCYT